MAAAGAAWWQLRRAARRHRVAAHQRVAARRHALAHPGVPIAGSALRIPVHGPLSEHGTMADWGACASARLQQWCANAPHAIARLRRPAMSAQVQASKSQMNG